MIRLTRLNHIPLILNSDLIEYVESNPDTVITLTTGQKLMVLELDEEVVQRIVAFRRAVYAGTLECPAARLVKQATGTSESTDSGNRIHHGD